MGLTELYEYIQKNPHIRDNPVLREFVTKLSRYCDFTDAWKDRTPQGHTVSEMGYTRSDYDGHRWWTSAFPLNSTLSTLERSKEIDSVTDYMIRCFPTLNDLGMFCELFAEDLRRDNEYNVYYKGHYANYWMRCIIRNKDYNLYVHAIIPTAKEG